MIGWRNFISQPGSQNMQQANETAFFHFLRDSLTRRLVTDAAHGAQSVRAVNPPVVYVPKTDPACEDICRRVGAEPLPDDPAARDPHALLWQPYPYVMAGPSRYREQYYWDSRFNIKGLLAVGALSLAMGMVRNLFYQVEHYGVCLNANRAWSLQVLRSQPPFLSTMVFDVAEALVSPSARAAWLAEALPWLEKTYDFWRRERYDEKTGLFHYGATGPLCDTPCPELDRKKSRITTEKTHYEDALDYFAARAADNADRRRFYDEANKTLKAEFYIHDRAMREAGCDPTDRFGPFSCRTADFDPVCLNSLMAKHCADMVKAGAKDAEKWQAESERIAARVNELMWNEQEGMYFDYDRREGALSTYAYLTAAFPLFAGIAPKERAERVLHAIVKRFETGKSLRLAETRTGKRWDDCDMLPYVAVAVEGLAACGFDEDARRIEQKRVAALFFIWLAHGVTPEKFDAETGDIDMKAKLLASAAYNDGDARGGAAFAWNAADVLWAEKRFGPGFLAGDDPLLSGLTPARYEVLRAGCFKRLFEGLAPSPAPRAIMTGGLSGFGKTAMTQSVLRHLADLVIDADALRQYHPRYQGFLSEYGAVAARNLTRDFCDRLATDVQAEALARGLSFIREGTLQLPDLCVAETEQAVLNGHDVVLVVLAGQAGDEELGRHLRYWEMRAAAMRGETEFVREIENTYDDARAQNGVLLAMSRFETFLQEHAAQSPQARHRIVLFGRHAEVLYCNDFAARARDDLAWAVYAAEYDRPRTRAECAALADCVVRVRGLMQQCQANQREWDVFQRLVDDRLARALSSGQTARPQAELAKQAEKELPPSFDPAAVWTAETRLMLQEFLDGGQVAESFRKTLNN